MTDAVAIVGKQAISPEAFLAQLTRSSQGKHLTPESKKTVLDEMIRFEVMYQQALASGYTQDPELAAELKRLIARRFEERELSRLQPAQVSPEEISDYYARNQERFGTPAKVRAALIELKVSRTAAPQIRAEVAQRASGVRLEALTNSAPDGTFGLVAQRYSEHQASRYRGGDLGWMTRGTADPAWPPEVTAGLAALAAPGDTSPVIETASAFYILRLVDQQPARVRPLAEVRNGIEYLVRRQKEEEQRSRLAAAQRASLEIRINQPLLDSISLPSNEPRPPGLPGARAQK